MKLCPKCRSKYTDDTLTFCLQDGTPLVDESDEGEPTVAFGDLDTVESGKEGRIGIEIPREEDGPETVIRPASRAATTEPVRRSGALRTTLILGALVFTFAVIAGTIGGVAYLNWGGRGNTSNTGATFPSNIDLGSKNANESGTSTPENTPEGTPTPEPAPSESPTPESSPTPDETTDPDGVKAFVREHLQNWKLLTESQRLDELMSFYDERLDRYYRRTNVSKSVVRRDKANAFARLDSLKITISNLKVTSLDGGEKAIAEFDKEWRFAGGGKVSTGKVRSRFGLRRYGDSWLITAESDLKVYYTR